MGSAQCDEIVVVKFEKRIGIGLPVTWGCGGGGGSERAWMLACVARENKYGGLDG